MIDGGKGQLAAGLGPLRGFRERGVAVISLAKRIEEVFLPGRRAPLVLDHSTPELQLLQRVRDEAHRFAITHHRSRRDRAMTSSLLDELPGVGPARKRALLAHFGSPEAVLGRHARGAAGGAGAAGEGRPRAARRTCTAPAEPGGRQSARTRHRIKAVSATATAARPPGAPTARRLRRACKELVVITGFSGAGKSTAMNVFEDAGYFCVDNLPPEMIRSLVELFVHEGSKVERAAVVSDVRGGVYFEALQAVVDDLDSLGLDHHVLFLEAAEQTLVNRYKETRRRHPLAPDGWSPPASRPSARCWSRCATAPTS